MKLLAFWRHQLIKEVGKDTKSQEVLGKIIHSFEEYLPLRSILFRRAVLTGFNLFVILEDISAGLTRLVRLRNSCFVCIILILNVVLFFWCLVLYVGNCLAKRLQGGSNRPLMLIRIMDLNVIGVIAVIVWHILSPLYAFET